MTPSETLKTRASLLTGFLGLQRNTVGVLAMVVLVGLGERMAERFLPHLYDGPWGWCAGHWSSAGHGQPALGPLLISGGVPCRDRLHAHHVNGHGLGVSKLLLHP